MKILVYLSLICSCCCQILLDNKCFKSILVQDPSNCDQPTPDIGQKVVLPKALFGTVCCHSEKIGCYSNTENTIWDCFPTLPDCMSVIQPEFYVYTPENGPDKVQNLEFFNLQESVKRLQIDNKRQFFVIIHGFGSEWPKPWVYSMKNELLKIKNNVMIARWSKGAQNDTSLMKFFKAVANSRSVASAIAKVLCALIDNKKVDLDLTTVMGFSLGAQIAGMIGGQFKALPRIIALDPAGPLFTCQNPITRLDPTDAKFVQVLHTNGDNFLFGGIGSPQPMGHVDFYANNGAVQPGCKKGKYKPLKDLLQGSSVDQEEGQSFWCSHTRAAQFFIEMLKQDYDPLACRYQVFPCDSVEKWQKNQCFSCPPEGCPVAGYNILSNSTSTCTSKLRGKYFFNTQSDTTNGGQFCGAQHLVSLTPDVNVTGKITLTLIESRDYEQEVEFQGLNDILIANQENKRIFSISWQIKLVLIIKIRYEEYEEPQRDINRSWRLINCSVTNYRMQVTKCKGPVTIEQDKWIRIELGDG